MSETIYRKVGSSFFVAKKTDLVMCEQLPPAVFTISQTPQGELYLTGIDNFKMPKKLYGETNRRSARIMNTFQDRSGSTGVLLAGEKGSGKSLLAMNLALANQSLGNPTIVINQPWCGEAFNSLIQSIGQDATILFDEFEKVYADKKAQEAILTLLDGVYKTRKLFVFTVNNSYAVDEHMKNRPARIFYNMEFTGLSTEFAREYCEDRLNNKAYIEAVCQVASVFEQFNFDMLQALIEEMNRYDESPQDAIKLLNAKPRGDNHTRYDVRLFIGDNEIPKEQLEPEQWRGSPVHSSVLRITREWRKWNDATGKPSKVAPEDADDSEWGWETEHYMFTSDQCSAINSGTNTITYTNRSGPEPITVMFSKAKVIEFGFSRMPLSDY